MWPFTAPLQTSTTPVLDQEFIARYWDLEGRVIHLESNVDDRLHELEKRYKRAEQSERRLLEGKKAPGDCEDCPDENPLIKALKLRQGENRHAAQARLNSSAG